MQKFDPKRSLWLYKLWEYLLLFDGSSEEERMLAYRYGWHIFSSNRQHFEDFSLFLRRRKWFIYLSLIYPILITFISLLLALSVLTIEVAMKVPLALIFSGVTAGIIYNLIGKTLKNIRETAIFLRYVNPNEKLANFLEFENLDLLDKENALLFYENMRAKRDYIHDETPENNLDKTEKLLAVEFLLGGPGTLNELINKLCLNPNCSLSKEGVYRVLGVILSASPNNIKKDIVKGVKEIRSGENLSSKRIDQLRNVKAIFSQSKLGLKANEIDSLIFNQKKGSF
ncbi:hypothetical protein SAMN04488057_104219 [Cyclobacterium lianum]|uniref:Uncharacterized protein n=1 Tax=Cyclobacterium lianum TaxID=388280 RepID=A0A1M7MCA2_9BACT|nr:hypothetical protein [Cyclobacterium lianum]SHM88413.1 hypothetical protein SAMN04488057_104219 [Cyclobacterium lianum]